MQQVKGPLVRQGPGVSPSSNEQGITYRGLILVGVGGIIGAGFFLGCGLPIRMAGPGVLVAFVIGGLVTAQVVGALTSIAVHHPVKGSFTVYSNTYIGRFAGFLQGWTYYLTGILTITSEAVAMGIFTKLWLPFLPVGLAASIYAVFIVLLNAIGMKNFTRVESVMSVVKIAALVGFILYALILVASLWFGHGAGHLSGISQTTSGGARGSFLPTGFRGVMQSMLIVIFAYGGIGVFASATAENQEPGCNRPGRALDGYYPDCVVHRVNWAPTLPCSVAASEHIHESIRRRVEQNWDTVVRHNLQRGYFGGGF